MLFKTASALYILTATTRVADIAAAITKVLTP
jgi:hypothetical protein